MTVIIIRHGEKVIEKGLSDAALQNINKVTYSYANLVSSFWLRATTPSFKFLGEKPDLLGNSEF